MPHESNARLRPNTTNQKEQTDMFCPNCGTDNSKGQKFCTRCGMNLLAIDRAREIVSEIANAPAAPMISPNLVFVTAALISIIGFIVITVGTYEFSRGENNGPLSVIFPIMGFASMVTICRYLLKLISPPAKMEARQMMPPVAPSSYTPPQLPHGTTNRSLGEAPAYQSIVEDPTRQFEHERRSGS